jgi:hypothetical protein
MSALTLYRGMSPFVGTKPHWMSFFLSLVGVRFAALSFFPESRRWQQTPVKGTRLLLLPLLWLMRTSSVFVLAECVSATPLSLPFS